MAYPPRKRLKSLSHNTAAFNDPFGDDDDFTQDDLEEIDVLASQAVTGDTGGQSSKVTLPYNGTWPGEPSRSFSGGRKTSDHARTGQTRDSAVAGLSNSRETFGFQCKDPFGNGHHSKAEKEPACTKLEAQQTELKKKLKEVEEEILMKNGEIRVLRDSLRVAQQEKEQQRQAQLVKEKEKAHAQSEKEKELFKKVQSLQSELLFKEAEMNEMKTQLKHSERGTKAVASPVTRNSPRAATSAALLQHTSGSSSSASPGGHAFITKETFAAQLPARSTPVKACGSREDGKQPPSRRPSDIKDIDPFNCPTVQHHQGSALLSVLLQHPLSPSSLGLCHLLCISLDAMPARLQNNYLSSGSFVGSSSSSTETPRVVHKSPSRFSQLQSLAMSGLNMMSLPEYLPSQPRSPHCDPTWTNPNRSCPGAVHLLPLLDYHIGLFCQTLEAMDSSGKSPLRGSSLSGSSSEGGMASSMEDSLSNQEEFALASIRALYHVASQSREAVDVLLSCHPQENSPAGGEPPGPPQGTNRPSLTGLQQNHTETGTGTGRASETPDRTREGLPLQHPLFRRLLQLSDPVFSCHAIQRECLVRSSLETLNVLAERAEETHLSWFKCVLSSQAMMRCLSLDSSYQTLSLSVSLLAVLVNNDEVAIKLCSHLDSCLFLKIFQYITSRPDKQVTERQWSQLEVEVVRFLTKLFTQKVSTWGTFIESSCQCHSEVVQTVVVLLHRQWLDIRGREGEEAQAQAQTQAQWTSSPGVHLLRESLMFLHWLLLNHSSFSEHCRPVLHMYDQIIPAVRDTFRRIPDLTESEELALEEICRPEAEDTEDMDIDTCS